MKCEISANKDKAQISRMQNQHRLPNTNTLGLKILRRDKRHTFSFCSKYQMKMKENEKQHTQKGGAVRKMKKKLYFMMSE